MKQSTKSILLRVFHPLFWLQIRRSDAKVSQVVNKIIDDDLINKIDNYVAYTSDPAVVIWIGNYPYCYGSLVDDKQMDYESYSIPDAATRLRLRNYLKQKFKLK